MARVTCSVRMGRFKPDRAGYAALMDSFPVQHATRAAAESVRGGANAILSKDGYRLVGFEMKPFQGKLARGYVVRTKTDHARYSQARHKTLQKALGAVRG